MEIIGYITDLNINDLEDDPEFGTKHGRIIEVHSVRKKADRWIYTGKRHESDTEVTHQMFSEVHVYKDLASAQAIVDAWINK